MNIKKNKILALNYLLFENYRKSNTIVDYIISSRLQLVVNYKENTFGTEHFYIDIDSAFNIPKVINKLLCSWDKHKIELGLNLLLAEKIYEE
jgi:hypothetical protein